MENPKRTLSASSGFGPVQMILEPDIGRCASEEPEPQRGVGMRQCANKDVGLQREVDWGGLTLTGDCEISHRLGRRMKHHL